MKLILHIGTEKTGTTTLQHWFASNRESLQLQGIYYPKSLGKANHRKLSVFAMNVEQPDDYFEQHQIVSIEDHEQFKSNLIQDFEQEYAEKSDIKTWVISNEHLHSRLKNVEMIEQVKQFLGHKFETIEVLVHLRPQVDVAVSHTSTAARMGKPVNSRLFSQKEASMYYYNYNRIIKYWEAVFGAKNITIVSFKRQPCMTSFLIKKLGIGTDELSTIKQRNQAVDWRTMALVNSISVLDDDKHKSSRQNYNIFINDLPCREKLRIGLDLAKQFQSTVKQSNARLISRRQELDPDDLTPDWSKYDIPQNIHYLDSLHAPIFTEQLDSIIRRFNWELQLEKCQTKLAECERSLVKNNRVNAQRFLEKAQIIILRLPDHETINPRLEQIKKRIERLSKKI